VFQKKPLIYILLSLLIFFIIIEISSFYIGYKEATKRNFLNDTHAIQTTLESQELTLKTIASFLSKDKSVLDAYKYNNPTLLKNHINPIWKEISKKQYIHEIHFFKPPAISFVNFSDFKSIGTDVSDSRLDIKWITSSFQTSTHTLICKTYAGIRTTYPIIDENKKMLGGLSIGKKLDWLTKSIKKDTHHDAFLIYTKEATRSLSNKYYQEFMKNKKTVGKYIFADRTSSISPNIIKSLNFNKDIQKISTTNSPYFLYRYPIVDFNGNVIAYIFTLDDMHIYYKEFFKIFIKHLFIFSIITLIIFFIVKYFPNTINKKLQRTIDTLNDAQRTAQIGSYLYDIKAETLEWSDEHYRLFKVDKNSFTPSLENFLAFVHPKDKELIKNKLQEALQTKERIAFQYSIILNDSTMLDVESTSQIVQYSKLEEPLIISGTVQNISELKKLEKENQNKSQELIKQLYTDKLTNIANRTALIYDIAQNKEAFIAIINIRSFKNINDVFGFINGNFILKELAQLLFKMLSGKNIRLYRIGNDEFALINSQNILKKDFEHLIKDITKKVENTQFYDKDSNFEISVAIYAGICFNKGNRLAKADIALSQASATHKDYIIYSEKLDTINKQKNKLKIIGQIKKALYNDDILVYNQPIVNKEKKIVKYEALVRMQYGKDILSPYVFLEISKKTKYYTQITQRVVQKTFEIFKNKKVCFSINLIAQDILNDDTINYIKQQLNQYEDKEKIIFELVESEDLYSIPEVAEFIKYIQSTGAKIAIDDFGTGYSNFSYMMHLRPDYLKIDGSLIKNLDTNKDALKIVKTIITFAKELNIITIAEFVHSKQIFDICNNLGIDEFQGYYFGEPITEI